MITEQEACNRRVADWFSQVIAESGLPQKVIAKLLDLSDSAVSRIKSQQQNLSAAQMLILHEELGAPLPTLKAGRKKDHHVQSAKENNTGGATALFDLAYDQVAKLNRAIPEGMKMSQHELLETVFHAMKRIATDKNQAKRTERI